MDNLKYLLIGDDDIEKICLIETYTTGSFPGEYIPTCYDGDFVIREMIDKELAAFKLWVVNGQDDYDKLRPLSYPDTDLVLICFSVDQMDSLERVREKWLPEVKQYCVDKPVILVACKIDLRSTKDQASVLSRDDGVKMAKELGIEYYFETSSLKNDGVRECFEYAVRVCRVASGGICLCNRQSCNLPHKMTNKEKRKTKCQDDKASDRNLCSIF